MKQRVSFSSSSESGFSLLELAIVLLILGTIAGFGIPLLTAHMTRMAITKTRAHQDYVVDALAMYVEKHRRLPCPAASHIQGMNFGIAQESCRMEKAQGIVPFKTLGISESYARDGFKRFMTYVVEPELAKKLINPQEEAGGLITVKNDEGYNVLASNKQGEKNQNYIAFVIVSHDQEGPKTGNAFTFTEGNASNQILRWESRDQFFKHYVQFPSRY